MSVVTDDDVFAAIQAIATKGDLPAPASLDSVLEAESALGGPLPPLLRRLLLEVANGGFGPDDGIIGVRGPNLVHTEARSRKVGRRLSGDRRLRWVNGCQHVRPAPGSWILR